MHTTSEKQSKGRYTRNSKVTPETIKRRKELSNAIANNDLLARSSSPRLSRIELEDVFRSIGVSRVRFE